MAGPWISNEEAKLLLVIDIADHEVTVPYFWGALAEGKVLRRRLSPIAEVETLQELAERL